MLVLLQYEKLITKLLNNIKSSLISPEYRKFFLGRGTVTRRVLKVLAIPKYLSSTTHGCSYRDSLYVRSPYNLGAPMAPILERHANTLNVEIIWKIKYFAIFGKINSGLSPNCRDLLKTCGHLSKLGTKRARGADRKKTI